MSRPKAEFCVTYDRTTPESAEAGCTEEGGWWMPGGWLYAIDRGNDEQERQRIQEARDGEFDLTLKDLLRSGFFRGGEFEASPHCRSFSCSEVTSSDDDQADGSLVTHYAHGRNLSPASIRRVCDLLGAREVNGWRYPEYPEGQRKAG